ncbi:MAG: helix-turn-helix domain-containing protein [Myxococcota bacterium]|nr:helix-turn-helix domain-containing protein [Myxococcota bacterium]
MFGLKLRRARDRQGLTLAELAQRAGMSVSYLAELEAGKKYPRADKILRLAQALGCSYDELISSQLDSDLDALQQLLNSPGVRDFPFELFGVPADELLRLLTRSPAEVGALLRALADIAGEYNIGVEHLLHAALRSYQEMTGNYYEDIEAAAERFAREALPRGAPVGQALRDWVRRHCVEEIDEHELAQRPALLDFRSVLCPGARPRLLLNPQLNESQRAFALAREAGYHVLGLTQRALTTPPDCEDSFEQVLSDFKASYFAGAVLLPRRRLLPQVRAWLRQPVWQPSRLLELLAEYQVSSETLMYRLSQLLPGEFGVRPYFMKLQEHHGQLQLTKQLNLTGLPLPSGLSRHEHYCRRWLGSRLLHQLGPGRARGPLAGALRAQLVGRDLALLCLGLAQPQPLRPGANAAFSLWLPADEALRKVVRFCQDPALPEVTIGRTCESCPLTPAECSERAAPPTRYLERLARVDRQRELRELTGRG